MAVNAKTKPLHRYWVLERWGGEWTQHSEHLTKTAALTAAHELVEPSGSRRRDRGLRRDDVRVVKLVNVSLKQEGRRR